MHSPKIVPIILCGGSGTRLWPVSRKSLPKQFVPLLHGKSLIEHTLDRMRQFSLPVITVSAEEHRFLIQDVCESSNCNALHIFETTGRNTAPAMTVAALTADPEDLLLFTPSDHYIPDIDLFSTTVFSAVDVAQAGYIVTFGVAPTHPNTAYGYITKGIEIANSNAYTAQSFTEKPKKELAELLLLQGNSVWNAGIFLVKAQVLLDAVKQYAPDIFTACTNAVAGRTMDGKFVRLAGQPFLGCRSDSIDYAVLEHSANVAVFPFLGQWSDVGSWNSLAELSPADSCGNRLEGQGFCQDSVNTYIHAPHRPVVALGTKDLMIIDTPDALLVVAASHTQMVKDVVATLEDSCISQATQHRRNTRPWGNYDSVDTGERFQVKRITVKPGGKLSLQMHHHRAEHWVVVKGTAKITKGSSTFLLAENQSTYIPLGIKHRLKILERSL